MKKVTPDMNIIDFLMMEGWPCYLPSHYKRLSKEERRRLDEKYRNRREKLPRDVKVNEMRFSNSLTSAYYTRDFKTIGDFKNIIEEKGILYRHMGFKGLAHFNETLKKHGLEPVKVGGPTASYNARLRRYGLEKAY